MYCNNCGSEVKDGAKFCPVCGEEIRGDLSKPDNSKRAAKKVEEIVSSETVRDVQEKAKLTGNWYVLNWKRLGDGDWKEAGLKHHLAWIGLHLGIIIVLFLLIGAIRPHDTRVTHDGGSKNKNSSSKSKSHKDDDDYDHDNDDDSSGFGDIEDTIKEAKDNIDYYKKVLFKDLTGTWTNSSGTFAITIGEDGTVKIADSTGTFGADAFTYTEVDDDTVRLKVDTDNALVGMFSVDMDYECDGETLTISALNQTYVLTRSKSGRSSSDAGDSSDGGGVSIGGFALGDIIPAN